MKFTHKIYYLLLVGIVNLLFLAPVNAIPAFASKYEKKCSYCHKAWPQLNHKGRKFKEMGYRLPADLRDTAPKLPYFEAGSFPISLLMSARPYDKKDSGDRKVRALHEAELFVAGAVGKNFSGLIELEGEDETGFEPEFGNLAVHYNINRALNFQAIWGAPVMWADPYGFLGDRLRLTRGHVGIIDQKFGGANSRLRSPSQSFNITGRLANFIFYSTGVSGSAGDAEGESADNIHARIAVDITKKLMIGAFGISGTTNEFTETSLSTNNVGGIAGVVVETSKTIPERDFTRLGFDFQTDIFNARFQAGYVLSEDENDTATAKEKNSAFSAQSFYVFKTKKGKPTFVPLIRYDTYEKKDGAEGFGELTVNLGFYFQENVKLYLEYWDQLSIPPNNTSADNGDSRVTFQFFVAW